MNGGEEVEDANCATKHYTDAESFISENMEVQSNSIIDEFECALAVGRGIKSVDDAYLLYCEYAHVKGFSARRGKEAYFSGSVDLYMKEFECSSQGIKDKKRSANNNRPTYQNLETRTKCKARLRIGRKKNESWKVTIFETEHTHEMAVDSQKYLLRSARKVSYAQGETLRAMSNAGIKPSNALSYMENESHGVENLGFIRKDAYNYLNQATKGHSRIENGDAFELIRYFKGKSNDGDLFYWDIQMDENGRLSSFFFRDNRARIDYEYFGDVISFDTTYRTNKYNLICAPFVGINHHMDNVMFGLAFISDETVASFEWLFKTFLESMGGKQPETIFTDQCQSMMNAIQSVFSCSQHRLCQWHISKNAPSHLGSLNTNHIFRGMFTKCMQFCESEAEFNEVWRKMIDDFGLEEHSWLNGMYKLRHKWSTAFSMDKFSVGLKATSRSEGTNAILKDGGKRTSTLFEFVQKRWRTKENEEDFKCHHKMPTIAVKNQPLLQHAASIYTLEIYKIFENELVNSLNIEFACPPSFMGNRWEYSIRSLGQSRRIRSVKFDMETNEVSCSCHHFETVGVLCKHILIILKFMNVHKIPAKYINLRWTKGVRNRVLCSERFVTGCGHESNMVYRNQTMRLCYELTTKSTVHIDLKKLMRMKLQSLALEMNEMLESLKFGDEINDKESIGMEGFVLEKNKLVNDSPNIDEVVVRDPIFIKSKGTRNTCMPSHWNSKGKKRKEMATKNRKQKIPKSGNACEAPSLEVTYGGPLEFVTNNLHPTFQNGEIEMPHNRWPLQLHSALTNSMIHMEQDLHGNFSEFTQNMIHDPHNSFQDGWRIN